MESGSIAVGANYQCSYEQELQGTSGDSQTSTTTATATDDDGNTVSATGVVTIDFSAGPADDTGPTSDGGATGDGDGGGCSCRSTGSPASQWWFLLGAIAVTLRSRARKR